MTGLCVEESPGRPEERRGGDLREVPLPSFSIVQRYAQLLQTSLSREGRAPFVLGGIALYDDLSALQGSLAACLQIRENPYLRTWHTALGQILPAYTQPLVQVRQGHTWIEEIRQVLDAAPLPTLSTPGPGSDAVARTLAQALGRIADMPLASGWLADFRMYLFAVSTRYWKGLFPCYGIVGLPRTNNDLEREFGQIKQGLRRQLGFSQIRRPLQRYGAWLAYGPPPPTVEEVHDRFKEVPLEAYRAERARWKARQVRFQNRYRWRHAPAKILSELETTWAASNPNTS